MGEGKRGTGVGMASVLLIAMVLAFTIFGVLSLVSALSDVRMSRKAVQRAAAYYEAEEDLQEQLSELDGDLLAGRAEIPADGIWELKADVEGTQELRLTVEREQSGALGGQRFQILWQQLVNTTDWNPDTGIDIWDGGM